MQLVNSQSENQTQAARVWQAVTSQARTRWPSTFDQWFSSVQFDGLQEGMLFLTARDEFVRDWVVAHFHPGVVADLGVLLGVAPERLSVRWRISANLDRPVCDSGRPAAQPESVRPRRLQIGESLAMPPATHAPATPTTPSHDDLAYRYRNVYGDPINPKHTFDHFVVGPSNELAHAATLAATGTGRPKYNPLFVCGGTGLGKTHLMHSIANKVLEEEPDARILYMSAERFTNEFIEALQHHRMEEFRSRYRHQCDLLLVDDIQFLAGREQTQEEFFHTFNTLRDAGKPIVVSSDKYPQDLQRMPERLISRFNSGLVADVQVPALETRVAIVRKKAAMEGINISDDVAVLLAQSIKSNIRELEGTLIRLAAKASLTGRIIDSDFAGTELAMIAPRRAQVQSVADIQRAVCGHFHLTQAELLGKDRHKSVAFARQVAMYLCRQRLKSSFPELGRAFGNRDHTTVMSAVRRVESRLRNDADVEAHIEAITAKLTESS